MGVSMQEENPTQNVGERCGEEIGVIYSCVAAVPELSHDTSCLLSFSGKSKSFIYWQYFLLLSPAYK